MGGRVWDDMERSFGTRPRDWLYDLGLRVETADVYVSYRYQKWCDEELEEWGKPGSGREEFRGNEVGETSSKAGKAPAISVALHKAFAS